MGLKRSRLSEAIQNNPISSFGLVVLIIFLLMSFFPQWFSPLDPTKMDLSNRQLPPSYINKFGTDQIGMDVYTRVIYGAQTTLKIVTVVVLLASGVGVIVGAISAYFGGTVDLTMMRITDMFLAFPPFILAVAVNAALGRGMFQTVIAVAIAWWPSYSRLIRGQVLSVKHEEYVVAALMVGSGPIRVLFKHILRNCLDPIIVIITLDLGLIALTTAGLSFLGLGAQPPIPEWGRMVNDGRKYILNQWWITTFPGLALFFVVVGFNMVGEILRDWLDPSGINRK